MNQFKLLNIAQESSYFDEPDEYRDEVDNARVCFYDWEKIEFLKELNKHADAKKQAGYSKSRNCDYISIVLVGNYFLGGEFHRHEITSTCLLKKDNKVVDSNNHKHMQDLGNKEISYAISKVYHHLPDDKIVEYSLQKHYQSELENIYNTIFKVRNYYNLNEKFPEKISPSTLRKTNKI